MGYLRTYQLLAGDPGFSLRRAFKPNKRIRKLARGVGRLGGAVLRSPLAGFIPGVGPGILAAQRVGLMGDPGFFGGLGRIAGRFVGGLARSGVGKAAGTILGAASGGLPGMVLGGVASGVAGAAVQHFMEPHGGRKKYRRMNPGNTRALARSMRRVQAFAKLARSTMTFTHTHRMKTGRKRRR